MTPSHGTASVRHISPVNYKAYTCQAYACLDCTQANSPPPPPPILLLAKHSHPTVCLQCPSPLSPTCLQFSSLHDEFWQQLESLPVDAPLPSDLPSCFYFHLHSYLTSGRYADRLQPWVNAFGRDRWAGGGGLTLTDGDADCNQYRLEPHQLPQR